MFKFILFLFLFSSTTTLLSKTFNLELEHARTSEEKAWGLMGRQTLPFGSGMLFHYNKKQFLSVWSFNCLIDLSVAFLDENLKILSIQELKSYPEKMDPRRPVYCLADMKLYPWKDPITRFFSKKAIYSSKPAKFILEVPLGWFEKEGIQVGDQLQF